MQIWKIIPATLLSRKHGKRPVVKIEALPPSQHPNSPIVKSMTCVVCTLDTGEKRYFGTDNAKIGPDLCMHMIVNPRNEVQATWKDSKFFPLSKHDS